MPPDAVDVRSWCERAGLSGVREVVPLTTGRSGSVVAAVRTSSGPVVAKVTTEPGRLARARREVAVLRHLASQPVLLAPSLCAAATTEEGVVVVLDEAAPLAGAGLLTTDDWRDVATAVAEVHRVPVPDSLGLPDDPRGSALPRVLEHGDCHVDNLVRDRSGRVLLVDWQEARVGDGLADLVFVWQRAEFTGAHPPRVDMTATYAAVRGLDVAGLAPLLDRAELRLLREAWPPFLHLGDDTGRAALAGRLAALTSREVGPTLPT